MSWKRKRSTRYDDDKRKREGKTPRFENEDGGSSDKILMEINFKGMESDEDENEQLTISWRQGDSDEIRKLKGELWKVQKENATLREENHSMNHVLCQRKRETDDNISRKREVERGLRASQAFLRKMEMKVKDLEEEKMKLLESVNTLETSVTQDKQILETLQAENKHLGYQLLLGKKEAQKANNQDGRDFKNIEKKNLELVKKMSYYEHKLEDALKQQSTYEMIEKERDQMDSDRMDFIKSIYELLSCESHRSSEFEDCKEAVREKMNQFEEELQARVTEVETLRAGIMSMEKKFQFEKQEKDEKLNELLNNIIELKRKQDVERGELIAQNNSLSSKIDNLQMDLKSKQIATEALKAVNCLKVKEIQQLKLSSTQSHNDVLTLKDQLHQKDVDMGNAANDIEAVNKEKHELSQNISLLNKEKDCLIFFKNRLEDELKDMKEGRDVIEKKLKTLKSINIGQKVAIKASNSRNAKLNGKIVDLEKKIKCHLKEKEILHHELSENQKHFEYLQNEKKEMQTKMKAFAVLFKDILPQTKKN